MKNSMIKTIFFKIDMKKNQIKIKSSNDRTNKGLELKPKKKKDI